MLAFSLLFPSGCTFKYFKSVHSVFVHTSTFMNYQNSESESEGFWQTSDERSPHFFLFLCSFQRKTAQLLMFNSLLSCCGWCSLKSWLIFLSPSLSHVAVEPGLWLSLEGAYCQVLFAGGLHIWLPSDGCHGWLVSCLFFVRFVPLVNPKRSIHQNYKKVFSHLLSSNHADSFGFIYKGCEVSKMSAFTPKQWRWMKFSLYKSLRKI